MNIRVLSVAAAILSLGINSANCQTVSSNPVQFQLQQGQWNSWNPVQDGYQWSQGDWSPWQPVPTETQRGRLHGNPPSGQQTYEVMVPAGFHSVPGYQLQPKYKTVYREETRTERIFNPNTGQYEVITYKQAVPFQVPVPSSGNNTPNSGMSPNNVPNNNFFLVTVINRMNQEVTFSVGGNSKKIPAGNSWQFNASHGQQYSYTGAPRQAGNEAMVGGGTFTGTISSNQRTIFLGQSSSNPNNPYQPVGGFFQVKFINTNSGSVDLSVYDQNDNLIASTKIQGGGQYFTSAKDGYSYVQGGPIVYRGGGAVSGTVRGKISSANLTITLGN